MAFEINFDGMIGPTHNYSGLSFGNIASIENQQMVSNPKEAALQGLEKMWFLHQLGIKQGIIPPHERPCIPILRALGHSGSDVSILQSVQKQNPELLSACSSSAFMWAANAATVSPSADTIDGKVHLTPANLIHNFHRSIETATTARLLKVIFSDPNTFEHHNPIPAQVWLSDEGAANHTRLGKKIEEQGIQLFVYGKVRSDKDSGRFPPRQALEASAAIARLHNVREDSLVFAKQNPKAIDQGVFHNDVISVGNENAFFYHEESFVDTVQIVNQLKQRFQAVCGSELLTIQVSSEKVSVQEAVQTYLFNSQLVTVSEGKMALIAPTECQMLPRVHSYLEDLAASKSTPISAVYYLQIRESMRNGGGPACLRLRIPLTEQESSGINPHFIMNETLYFALKEWVLKHYRDKLTPKDLADPQLLKESREALSALTQILNMGSFYDFQRT